MFFVEGRKIIEDSLLNSRALLMEVFYTKENEALAQKIIEKGAVPLEVSKSIMERISDTKTPQGIAVIAKREQQTFDTLTEAQRSFIVMCDKIKDPGNMGSIIRCACAFGAGAIVVLPDTCSPYLPKTIRASAGKVFKLPIIETGFDTVINSGVDIYVTRPKDGMPVHNLNLKEPFAVVFGEEAAGVSRAIEKFAKGVVSIEIDNDAESLNVGNAACVFFYETNIQRKGLR